MATETPTRPDQVEQLLALIDPERDTIDGLQAQIDPLRADQLAAFDRRGDVFLQIRETAPDVTLKRLAARAGVSVPAVIQAINAAKTRRMHADHEAGAHDQPLDGCPDCDAGG